MVVIGYACRLPPFSFPPRGNAFLPLPPPGPGGGGDDRRVVGGGMGDFLGGVGKGAGDTPLNSSLKRYKEFFLYYTVRN